MPLPRLSLCFAALTIAACLGFNSAAYCQSTWLTSIYGNSSGWTTCALDTNAVALFLQYNEDPQLRIGENHLWFDGDEGTLDFHSGNTSNFAAFTSYATNNTIDIIAHCNSLPYTSCTPHGCSGDTDETAQMGCPDLYGCEIDFIRLVVDSTHVASTSSLTSYFASYRWEFWGQGICGCAPTGIGGLPTDPGTTLYTPSVSIGGQRVEIRYRLGGFSNRAQLEIFDIAGRRVRTLEGRAGGLGIYVSIWDLQDAGGVSVPTGVFLVRLASDNRTLTKKIVVIR